eukprot:ANDGO_03007.mRNA.1 Trimethylguanosine synthase
MKGKNGVEKDAQTLVQGRRVLWPFPPSRASIKKYPHILSFLSCQPNYFPPLVHREGAVQPPIWCDEQGWYSVTPRVLAVSAAKRIAECGNRVVLDICAGVGGNSVAFASHKDIDWVGSIEYDEVRSRCVSHNAEVYGVDAKIEVFRGEAVSILHRCGTRWKGFVDAIFVAPPWGGPSYKSHSAVRLEDLESLDLNRLIRECFKITANVAVLLPRNMDLEVVRSWMSMIQQQSSSVREDAVEQKPKRSTVDAGNALRCQCELHIVDHVPKGVTVFFGNLVRL